MTFGTFVKTIHRNDNVKLYFPIDLKKTGFDPSFPAFKMPKNAKLEWLFNEELMNTEIDGFVALGKDEYGISLVGKYSE